MNAEDVLKLISAGFTADEIRQMNIPSAGQDPAPAPDITPDPAPSPAPGADPADVPETDPAPAPNPGADPDPLADIHKQIEGLTAVVDKMAKTMIGPSLDKVQPLGIEDIITKFFKEE